MAKFYLKNLILIIFDVGYFQLENLFFGYCYISPSHFFPGPFLRILFVAMLFWRIFLSFIPKYHFQYNIFGYCVSNDSVYFVRTSRWCAILNVAAKRRHVTAGCAAVERRNAVPRPHVLPCTSLRGAYVNVFRPKKINSILKNIQVKKGYV